MKDVCAAYGLEGLYPLDAVLTPPADGETACKAILGTCIEMIRRADALIADLSPFRGPYVDDGTAVEIGIAIEGGVPIFGYSSDLRPLKDRITHTISRKGEFRDAGGMEVENFGQPFNAMIAGALHAEPCATF